MDPEIERIINRRIHQVQGLIEKGLNSDDLETSIKYLDEAMELAEEDGVSYAIATIWGMKACRFMDAGAPPIIAINCLKRGIMIDPTYDVNYEILGRIYLDLDEPEIAMRYFNQGKLLSNKY